MVQTAEYQVEIAGCTAEELFRLVYVSPSLLKHFHAEINRDDAATITPWHSNTRELTFTTPVNVPSILSSIIPSRIPLRELQTCCISDRASIILKSNPVPQLPNANAVSTPAIFRIETLPNYGGCRIQATVCCTASGFGRFLNGTVESFVTTSAQESLQIFLDYIKDTAQAIIDANGGVPKEILSLPLPFEPSIDEEEEKASVSTMDIFMDALEGEEEERITTLPPEEHEDRVIATLEAAVLSLEYQNRTGDEIILLIRQLENRIARLETTMEKKKASPLFNGWFTGRQMLLMVGVAGTSIGLTSLYYKRKYRHI